MRARRHIVQVGIALLVGCAPTLLVACGEDGEGIRDDGSCPKQPLYHLEFVGDGGGGWVRLDANGTRLSEAELASIRTATTSGCLTPAGFATSRDGGN